MTFGPAMLNPPTSDEDNHIPKNIHQQASFGIFNHGETYAYKHDMDISRDSELDEFKKTERLLSGDLRSQGGINNNA